MYRFHEWSLETGKATGHIEHYQATSFEQALLACQYTHALKGPAKIGESRQVIHCGNHAYIGEIFSEKRN